MSDEEFAERVTAMTQTLYRVCYAQLSQACDREDAVQEALRQVLAEARPASGRALPANLGHPRAAQRMPQHPAPRRAPAALRHAPPSAQPRPSPWGPRAWARRCWSSRKSCACPWFCTTWRDIPWRDVAAVLRIPQGTVKTRLRRGREALKALLTPPIGGVSRDPG